MKNLVKKLNEACDAYYNRNDPIMSDREYDELYDKLVDMERETGIVYANSPTQKVGYEVKSSLEKVKHSHPMQSLDKTKSVDDLVKFSGDKEVIMSLKLDGLTVLLTYENGELVQAETRGNGEIGEIITHNARMFENVPNNIPYTGHFEIEGEAIITYEDFERINNMIADPDKQYRNPRNLASGSVRQLDSHIAKSRHIRFIAWKVPTDIGDKFSDRLNEAFTMGFEIADFVIMRPGDDIEAAIRNLRGMAQDRSYPIDGLVMTYNDITYGESLGSTGHHPKHSIAYKFYDETVETTLIDIEWSMGKTGVLSPVAVFGPVEIDGTIVSRASVHNVSILTELQLIPGDIIEVYKANQIIPQVMSNLSKDDDRITKADYMFEYGPTKCPICGGNVTLSKNNDTTIASCSNDNCQGKLLGKLEHYCSRDAMNIEGLSERTLEFFIYLGWLESLPDIYTLMDKHKNEMIQLEGFGVQSVNKLEKAIEKSRNTTLDRFIYALSIPLIGKSASKTISKFVHGDFNEFCDKCDNCFNWTVLPDFGQNMRLEIDHYFIHNADMIKDLASYLTFEKPQETTSGADLSGKTFVITGSLNTFTNRDEAKDRIESLGGKVSGSVSKKTSYLVNNDINSTSSKNKKAKELGIPIITEEQLLDMLK